MIQTPPFRETEELIGNAIAEQAFSISANAQPAIMRMLRDTLYAHKHRAVVREYIANALDATPKEGGRKIQVTVPSALSPNFVVRDFGAGLSYAEMCDLFASYGASTKQNTNEQIGSYGLGCKSAFCLVESFTIISYHGGFATTYVATLDTAGNATLKQIYQTPSDETGLEIQITADGRSIEKELWQFWWARERIETNYVWPQREIYRNQHGCMLPSRTYNDGVPNSLVVMGGWACPVTACFSISSTALFFNIGELDVNLSREELQYTERTKAALAAKVKAFEEQFRADHPKSYLNFVKLVALARVNSFANQVLNSWGTGLNIHEGRIYAGSFNLYYRGEGPLHFLPVGQKSRRNGNYVVQQKVAALDALKNWLSYQGLSDWPIIEVKERATTRKAAQPKFFLTDGTPVETPDKGARIFHYSEHSCKLVQELVTVFKFKCQILWCRKNYLANGNRVDSFINVWQSRPDLLIDEPRELFELVALYYHLGGVYLDKLLPEDHIYRDPKLVEKCKLLRHFGVTTYTHADFPNYPLLKHTYYISDGVAKDVTDYIMMCDERRNRDAIRTAVED